MYRLAQAIAWLLTTVCYRLKRTGGENIPAQGPAILVCNHIHMMDIACIVRQTPRKKIVELSFEDDDDLAELLKTLAGQDFFESLHTI